MPEKRKSGLISDEICTWLKDEDNRSWPPNIYVKGVEGDNATWKVHTFVYLTRDETHCHIERIREGAYKITRTWCGIVDEFTEITTFEEFIEVLSGEGISHCRWAVPVPTHAEVMDEWLNSPNLLMDTHTIADSGKQFPMWIVSNNKIDSGWSLQCRWRALDLHRFEVIISGEAPRLLVNVKHPDGPSEGNMWSDIRDPHEVLHCMKFSRTMI